MQNVFVILKKRGQNIIRLDKIKLDFYVVTSQNRNIIFFIVRHCPTVNKITSHQTTFKLIWFDATKTAIIRFDYQK